MLDRATLIGGTAVLMWSCLAPLTAAAAGIPSLQLLAATFTVAFVCGLLWLVLFPGGQSLAQRLRAPLGYLALAVTALFGYHALYFVALALARPAEASLTAYLWPLLIVLFSMTRKALWGALLGFSGIVLLTVSGGVASSAGANRTLGLIAALCCALIWSGYSVLNRRFKHVASDAMVGVCGLVAALGWIAHVLIDQQTVVASTTQWGAIVALGVGPVGLAFLAWDYGTKHGDLGVLGTISYAAPVLSTLLLVVLGFAAPSLSLLAACVLVAAGAWIAS